MALAYEVYHKTSSHKTLEYHLPGKKIRSSYVHVVPSSTFVKICSKSYPSPPSMKSAALVGKV